MYLDCISILLSFTILNLKFLNNIHENFGCAEKAGNKILSFSNTEYDRYIYLLSILQTSALYQFKIELVDNTVGQFMLWPNLDLV